MLKIWSEAFFLLLLLVASCFASLEFLQKKRGRGRGRGDRVGMGSMNKEDFAAALL